ncbi:MAG: phenylalanine--tRNA ligase subunit beta [Dehalococcoidia bacterium]|nr:phenylalanine--tRNA ligase subunit beta [Dehalococcoidia bacterium]
MKVPISWLREYIDITLPVKDLAFKLTLSGTEVEAINRTGTGNSDGKWENVWVGHVLAVDKHPNADRLRLATVDYGLGKQTVVCGAPNLAVGQKVAFATVGATLLDSHTGKTSRLEAATIRGVQSAGMCCSPRELGISNEHEGIIVLDHEAPVGKLLSEYLGEQVYQIAVTPNRPDCLSVIGVAREVSALTGAHVKEPDLKYVENGPAVTSRASVQVLNPELCSRYMASIVTGVKIGPSPKWMQDRLTAAGMRPINNVVDITNYVMMEYGQPLHAFDHTKLKDKKIIVRSAKAGERMVTLDGQERKLDTETLVIADSENPVALAGVMGGANSEVTEHTTAILLESACFNGQSIRRTAVELKLRSEASMRFEKGLPPELAEIALHRATGMLVQLAGGQASQGVLDVYPGRRELRAMTLTRERVKKVLGVDPSPEDMTKVLRSLGFAVQPDGANLKVMPPYWRIDARLEDDLAEEYARITGYDKIPTPLPQGRLPAYLPQPVRELKERVRDLAVAARLQEVITYAIVSEDDLKKLEGPQPAPLKLENPMSLDQAVMRTSLRPGLLKALNLNERQGVNGLTIFEIARVFIPQRVPVKEGNILPDEIDRFEGIVTGEKSSSGPGSKQEKFSFQDAKGIVETILNGLKMSARYEPSSDANMHHGRAANVVIGSDTVGYVGEVNPILLERFDVSSRPVFMFGLDIARLLPRMASTSRTFKPLPKYPGVTHDLALVMDKGVTSEKVQSVIKSFPQVADVTLFDIYEGDKLSQGKKQLAYRILYLSAERTLTTAEAGAVEQQILARLQTELGVTLRS